MGNFAGKAKGQVSTVSCVNPIFLWTFKISQVYVFVYALSPSPINLCISYLFKWKYFFFTIEIENYLRLSCFKLKVIIISLKPGFLSTPLAAQGNAEEEKRYEDFRTFRLSLTPLNLAKNVNF